MSKEYLEALKIIKIKCHPNSNPNPLVDEALDIVEQALQRLESIENAKPSEALKAFEEFKDISLENFVLINTDLQRLNTIKQALLKAQEQEEPTYVNEELGITEDTSIEYLISVAHPRYQIKLERTFRENNIKTIKDLINLKQRGIKNIRGLGQGSFVVIMRAAEKSGINIPR